MNLGDGKPSQASTKPVQVSGGPWQAVTAGVNASCAIDTAGAPYCWASSFGAAAGLVGNGAEEEQRAPVAVSGAISAVALTLGVNHACARSSAGELWCWGTNTSGELGDGGTADSAVPVAVVGGRTWSGVDGGAQATCGVEVGSAPYCWGRDLLGSGTLPPTALATTVRFASIEVGGGHACGVAVDQRLWCWATNGFGQVGTGTSSPREQLVEVALPAG